MTYGPTLASLRSGIDSWDSSFRDTVGLSYNHNSFQNMAWIINWIHGVFDMLLAIQMLISLVV